MATTYTWTQNSTVVFNAKVRVSQYNATFNNNRFLHKDVLGLDEASGDGVLIGESAPASFSRLQAATVGNRIIGGQATTDDVTIQGSLSVGASVKVYGSTAVAGISGHIKLRPDNADFEFQRGDGVGLMAFKSDRFALTGLGTITRGANNLALGLAGGNAATLGSILQLWGPEGGASNAIYQVIDGSGTVTPNGAIARWDIKHLGGTDMALRLFRQAAPEAHRLEVYNPVTSNDSIQLKVGAADEAQINLIDASALKVKFGAFGITTSTVSDYILQTSNSANGDIRLTSKGGAGSTSGRIAFYGSGGPALFLENRSVGAVLRLVAIGTPTNIQDGDIFFDGTNYWGQTGGVPKIII